jgi:arylsulfatase A-like enzyme
MAAAGLPFAAMGSRLLAERRSAKQTNIVYIFADQMRKHVLGCYGNKIVPTPNFDAMAKAGTAFDNAISTWPVCSPYRAMLLTGMYPMANGTVTNGTALRDDMPTIAKVCKAQGYATGYIGKWHLEWGMDPFVPKERRQGFDYWAVRNVTHEYMDSFYCADTPEPIRFKGYEPLVQTDLAIDYIKKNKDKPFCLFMSWGPPHDPYNEVPAEYKERIPLEEIELRKNVSERVIVDHLIERDNPSKLLIEKRKQRRAKLEDNELLKKQKIQGYYAHTAALDDCIGKIRNAIKDAGIDGDTILVFSSDHGDMLGCHRMALKQMPFEESINVPFIVEYPRSVPAGKRSDALIAPIDMMPTLLSLAGLKCPEVDGKDFSDAAKGVASDQRDALLIMKMLPGGGPYIENGVTPWRGVRTKRHTYANLFEYGPWLLYDNQEDPYQLNNLIDKPEHAELQAKLEKRMRELMQEAGDPGDTQKIQDFRESRQPEKQAKVEPVEEPQGKPSAEVDGWVAAGACSLYEKEDGLFAKFTGGSSYIEVQEFTPLAGGPFTMKCSLKSNALGKIWFIYNKPSRDTLIPFQIKSDGRFHEYEVEIPVKTLEALRFNPAKAEGMIEIDWVRILDNTGKTVQSWEF